MIVVIDTNVLISAALIKGSIPDQAVRKALSDHTVVRSLSTTIELSKTIKAEKFDRYFHDAYQRDAFLFLYSKAAKVIEIAHQVSICRDPKDNKFLKLALSADANLIITGDPDLLDLNPLKHVEILTPSQFVSR